MKHRSLFARLARDTSGVAGVMVAGSAVMLAGAATVAIDFGNMYMVQRRLQGVADAAAMAAAEDINGTTNGRSAADNMIVTNGEQAASIASFETGTYTRDADIDPDKRFEPTVKSPNAVRVRLSEEVPVFFAGLFNGKSSVTVTAQATASPMDLAAFSLGSRPVAFTGGIAGPVLNALAGTNLGLSDGNVQTLQGTTINLLAFADALRTQTGMTDSSFGDLFETPIPLDDVAAALATVAPGAGKTLLDSIASNVGTDEVLLSDFVDLGPYKSLNYFDGTSKVSVDALTLLRSALELSHGDSWDVSLGLSLAGLSNTTLRLAGGPGIAHSPLMTITQASGVTIRTSYTRMLLKTSVSTGIVALPTLQLPIYSEVAPSQATMTGLDCAATGSAVTLGVKPSIGEVAIGSIDTTHFDDFTTRLTPTTATLATVVGIKVTDYSYITLGGATTQSVGFTKSEVAANTWKSVSTSDAIGGIASSLIARQNLQVITPLGALPATNATTRTVGTSLSLAAPVLDATLKSVMQTLGVGLGVADTHIDRLRCGSPLLV